jgi:hypothetical protein
MPTSVAATARRVLHWEFLPEGVLLAGLTIFFVDQTDAAASAFKSAKALTIMVAVATGWLLGRLILARLLPFALGRAAVFSVAAAIALTAVVLPAYDDETVIESFPTAAAAPTDVAIAGPAPDAIPVPAPPAQVTPVTAPNPTRTTTRATTQPEAASPAPPEPTTSTTSTTQPVAVGAPPASPAPNPAPAGPERLRSGPIRGIDHRASGTAVIYRTPDGRYVVGLEDIDIQPGPDYDLYIVPGEDREDTKGGVRLGDLRGNKGTQFYEVPDGVDLENGPWTVLVWCQTFAVPVAGATPG